jgi:hypothetical protein
MRFSGGSLGLKLLAGATVTAGARRGASSSQTAGIAENDATGTLHALYFSLPIFWGSREQDMLLTRIGKLMMLYEGFEDLPQRQEPPSLNIVPTISRTAAALTRRRRRAAIDTRPVFRDIARHAETASSESPVVGHADAMDRRSSVVICPPDDGELEEQEATERNLFCPPGNGRAGGSVVDMNTVLSNLDASFAASFLSQPPVKAMTADDAAGMAVGLLRPTRRLSGAEWAVLRRVSREIAQAHRSGRFRVSPAQVQRWAHAFLRHETADMTRCLHSCGLLTEGAMAGGQISGLLTGDATGLAVAEAVLTRALAEAETAQDVLDLMAVVAPLGLSVPAEDLACKLGTLQSQGGPAAAAHVLRLMPFLECEAAPPRRERITPSASVPGLPRSLSQKVLPEDISRDVIQLCQTFAHRREKFQLMLQRWTVEHRQTAVEYLPCLIAQYAPAASTENRVAVGLLFVYLHTRLLLLPLPLGEDTALRALREHMKVQLLRGELLELSALVWSHQMIADLLCSRLCAASDVVLTVRSLRANPERALLVTGDLLVLLLDKKFGFSAEGWRLVRELRRDDPNLFSEEQVRHLETLSQAATNRASTVSQVSKLQRLKK